MEVIFMAFTNNKLGAPIGVDRVHCAVLDTDDANVIPVYSNLNALPGIRTVNVSFADNKSVEYFDNGPMYTFMAKGNRTVTVARSSLSNEEQRLLLGLGLDTDGYTVDSLYGTPPYIALGWRRLKIGVDGKEYYDYVWYLKGILSLSDDNSETRQENPAIQLRNLSGEFIARQCDGAFVYKVSTDDALDPADLAALDGTFFTLATINKLIVSV
jgi:phi13 family phage major tail protein